MSQSQYACEHPVPIEEEPHHHLVLTNELVRGFAVEIPPDGHTLCHRHDHEYIMYVAGDAQIISAPQAGEPKTHTYHDGACELSPPGMVHVVENLRPTRFRNLLVELLSKGPGSASFEGERVRMTQGDGRITRQFQDHGISLVVLELRRDSRAEISGPAIVASPYEHEVRMTTPDDELPSLRDFTDLRWVRSNDRVELWNDQGDQARIVTITFG